MPLQATSGAASYDAFGGGVAAVPNYIEDVFSVWNYTGNGSTQTITNGIDLAGKGGLVWWKNRTNATGHGLIDTTRGIDYYLSSNTTDAQDGPVSYISSVSSTGYSIGAGTQFVNQSANNYASWTFRKAPKFFDVVTWTGDASGNRVLNHALTSTPACIIIKATNAVDDWYVYHTSLGTNKWLYLNTTSAEQSGSIVTAVSSTTFTVSQSNGFNTSGRTYVAYLFAHNAGGFGLTGTDNVISCGSYTGNGSTSGPSITLGYEPQWILIKDATDAGPNWAMFDNMRGIATGGTEQRLYANTSGAEATTGGNDIDLTATGFDIKTDLGYLNTSGSTYIYIAIRRGPMKVPTSGTSVFTPVAYTGTSADATVTGVGFAPDLAWIKDRGGNFSTSWDRLRGATKLLRQTGTSAEETFTDALTGFDVMDGVRLGTDNTAQYINLNAATYINWNFRRAPSFFDEVCYTGTGTAGQTYTHNLGVVPELMIVKGRSIAEEWNVYFGNNTNYLKLNRNDVPQTATTRWNDTSPTSSVFSVGTSNWVNASGSTYVAYLFASLAGVSKVFSYTGNGSSQTINCGFTGGARFVLIKRTDAIGNWYVWDSARGIVSGNDPYLSLNTTAAEVTTDDSVDTDNTGFIVNQVSATNVNVTDATYIGLAIA